MFQRFGPINSDVGWRRLNVLFTRSRERMEVFSSMDAGDILVSETSSRGVRAFKQFLHYAATKNLEAGIATDRPPDSDFEIAVAKLLGDAGFECDFQIGVAGFFIDLAVKNPRRPGEYIMGVECDGATYHTGKSVRDRDRLRQEILESLGWEIRRVWSTDWFANPRGTLAPIIEELRKIVSVHSPQEDRS
jgi:very-short-patch-repair endonuclease